MDVYEDFDELADFALTSSEPPPPGTVSLEQELLSLITEPDSTLNKDDVAAWLLSEDAILTGQKLVAPILHPYPSPPSSGNDKYSISDSDSSDDEISEHSPPSKKSKTRSDGEEPAIASVVQVKKDSSKRRSDRRHRSRERGDRREERSRHRDTRGKDHSRPRTDHTTRPRRPQDAHTNTVRDHRRTELHRTRPVRHTPYVPVRNEQWGRSKTRDARSVLSARAEDRVHFEDKIKKLEQQIKESEQGARRLVQEARNAKEDLQQFVKKNVREDKPRRDEKPRREERRRKEERSRDSSQSRSRQSSQSRSRQNSRQSKSSRHSSESRSRQNSGKECSRKQESVREEEWSIRPPSKWDDQKGAAIVVTGFSSGTTRKELFTYFTDYGTVTDVRMSRGENGSQVACVIFKRQSEVDKVLGKEPKREDKKRRRASPPKETVEELDILTPPPANSFDMLLSALQQH